MQQAEKVKAKSAVESNFATALVAAGVMKVILDVNLVIPRTLISAAQNHDPEKIANGEWEWEYSTTVNQNNFGVRLTAQANGDSDATWRFFVTNSAANPPLENSLLFEGEATYDAESGSWTYYEPSSGEQVSVINWEVGEEERSLTLEVTSDRNDNFGDTIEYTVDGNIKTVIYTDASSGEISTLEFNSETHIGFIISPDYNNGEKSCWDEDLNNVACDS
ncbi:hypothetical protein [Gracilimonas mengyeensis]|nr:hypothetical protein [Gracilimonas mengyeensis]